LCVALAAGKPFNPLTKGKALAGLAHSLSMSELGMSEQIRLALNTIGATEFGRVSGWVGGRGVEGRWQGMHCEREGQSGVCEGGHT
jgi:hypothetical protein